ncbi:MAG TPA: cytochrome b/b6 domain-containing protein [Gammaproteobacteria bacterium]
MSKKLIWDLPTRIFHWLLTVLIGAAWYTVEISGDMDTHMLIGQSILALLLFRVLWGFFGTRYAQFGSFVYRPGEILEYAKSFLNRKGGEYAGHNPLGSLAVFAMLTLVLVQATTGLFATDIDGFYRGPLNGLVSNATATSISNVHFTNVQILLALIGVHIVAILFYLIVKRDNLITPMITGQKQDDDDSFRAIDGSKLGLAIGLLVAAVAIVLLLRSLA